MSAVVEAAQSAVDTTSPLLLICGSGRRCKGLRHELLGIDTAQLSGSIPVGLGEDALVLRPPNAVNAQVRKKAHEALF